MGNFSIRSAMGGVIFASLLISCSPKSEDAPSTQTDPIYGKWEYNAPGSTTSKAKGAALYLSEDKTVKAINAIAATDGVSGVMYFRKNIGTFTRSGDAFTFNYTYETCNPVGNEKLFLKVDSSNSNRLLVANESKTILFTMSRIESGGSELSITAMEDTGCTVVAANNKANSRVPANNSKSIFDGLIDSAKK